MVESEPTVPPSMNEAHTEKAAIKHKTRTKGKDKAKTKGKYKKKH